MELDMSLTTGIVKSWFMGPLGNSPLGEVMLPIYNNNSIQDFSSSSIA